MLRSTRGPADLAGRPPDLVDLARWAARRILRLRPLDFGAGTNLDREDQQTLKHHLATPLTSIRKKLKIITYWKFSVT